MPFLVFEGGEGSGKDTQIELLRQKLDPARVVITREPGGTLVGNELRRIVLGTKMEAETELLLFLAGRVEHVRTLIRPALDLGKLVICNRFALSTIAYQIYGRDQKHLHSFVDNISRQILGDLDPPYCILLDVTPEIGLARIGRRVEVPTVFDAENRAFHEQVRQAYLAHYNDDGRGVRIDANKSVEVVADAIGAQMKRWNL